MKYVVMYQSISGNTEKIAEEIYQNLPEWDTDIYDIDKGGEIPLAEVYFIGFGVQRGTCSMEIINLFEKIKGGKIALFATCGSCPTDHYKKQIESAVQVWLPEDSDYLGMFLCQGKIEKEMRQSMLNQGEISGYADSIRQLLDESESHPDEEDFAAAAAFAKKIAEQI